jgi:hypothetical protein
MKGVLAGKLGDMIQAILGFPRGKWADLFRVAWYQEISDSSISWTKVKYLIVG